MRRLRGFTLVELLVVIAIIAILATLVITQLSRAQSKAKYAQATSNLTEMVKGVEVYKRDTRSNGNPIAAMTAPQLVGGIIHNAFLRFPANANPTCSTALSYSDPSVIYDTHISGGPYSYIDPTGCNFSLLFGGEEKHGTTEGSSAYGVKALSPLNGFIFSYGTYTPGTAQVFGTTPTVPSCYSIRFAQNNTNNTDFPFAINYLNGVQQIAQTQADVSGTIKDCNDTTAQTD